MSAADGVVDLDLDHVGDLGPEVTAARAILVVARRAGVPVGSQLFLAPIPRSGAAILDRLTERADQPPGASGPPLAVTVAICTRNRPALLDRCLTSIAAAVAAAGAEVDSEVLVVDNASSDGGTRRVAEGHGARCEREPVPGLDVARNRAVGAARREVVAFVDDDVVVDELWLRTLARAFAAQPEAGAVTGQVLALCLDTPARVDFERTSGFSLGWVAASYAEADAADLPFRPGLGVGCNMAFRRAALAEVGPFDEALDTGRPLPGGGDIDMILRMVVAGRVVYEPSAVVFHEHRRTWKELRYQFYSWGKGWAVVLDKWYRAAPGYRPRIRGVARWTLRGFVADAVRGPERTGRYRRWHSVLLALGFVVGWTGAYGRSVRRVERRRRAVDASGPARS